MQGVSSHKLKVVSSASIHDVQAEHVIQQPDETLDRAPEPLTSVNSLAGTNRSFSFGPFRLIPAQRLLLEGETEVRLGSRAFEILVTMVEQPGELVSKAELMARVWPDTIVVEANLSVHVAALRRVLGDGERGNRYLITIPGRGYRFVAPVTMFDLGSPVIDQSPRTLPAQISPLGPADDLRALSSAVHALNYLLTDSEFGQQALQALRRLGLEKEDIAATKRLCQHHPASPSD